MCSYFSTDIKDYLEKENQIEAARIATETIKLVLIDTLYREIGCDQLEERKKKRKLTLFYKKVNNLTPKYLSSLLPPTVTETSQYTHRNANNIRTFNTRRNQYYNFFLPSTVRQWNCLTEELRNTSFLHLFKSYCIKRITVFQNTFMVSTDSYKR